MKNLKWKKDGDYYRTEINDIDFSIECAHKNYRLYKKQYMTWESVGCFQKLISAKRVAQLIMYG